MKKEMIETYLANRQLSYDLIERLSENDLDIRLNRPGLDTFRKHFLEMIAVQDAYANAIETGVMSFDSVPDVFSFDDKISKEEIIKKMKDSDAGLLSIIEKAAEEKEIFWFDMKLSLYTHVSNLVQHEVFHQGMITTSLYNFDIELPDSWIENWALPKK